MVSDEWHDPPAACLSAWTSAYEQIYLKGYIPIVCPCCNKAPLRVYWKKLLGIADGSGGKKGSGWMWCGACHAFQHWSAFLPAWWPISEPLGTMPLHTEPIELEQNWERILTHLFT